MSDPFDYNAVNDLNGIFKKKIHIVVSTPLKRLAIMTLQMDCRNMVPIHPGVPVS